MLRFKRPLADGSTQVRLSPKEFLRRLAGLVPPPGFHLVSYHGVFAARSPLRRKVAPALKGPTDDSRTPQNTNLALPFQNAEPRDRYLSWAELLKRTRGIDILLCQKCGGQMKLVAFVTQPNLAAEILEHLGLEPSSTGPPN